MGLWDDIERAWRMAHNMDLEVAVHISLFERAHTFIIHKNISAERSSVPSQQSSGYDEQPSDKQIKYAKDLGCKNPETMSRKQISDWIESNK